MKTNQHAVAILVLVMSLIISGCGPGQFLRPTFTPSPTSTPTSTPIPPTSTPTLTPTPKPTNTPIPTPTLPIEIPKPKEGRGVIIGQVVRGTDPVPYIAVQICTEYTYSGCGIQKYRVLTDSEGYYIFGNVKPGAYTLIVAISVDSVSGGYWSNSLYREALYTIEAGQTLYIEPPFDITGY